MPYCGACTDLCFGLGRAKWEKHAWCCRIDAWTGKARLFLIGSKNSSDRNNSHEMIVTIVMIVMIVETVVLVIVY